MFHSTHDTGVGSWNRTFNKLKAPAARARARDQCLFTENSGIVLGRPDKMPHALSKCRRPSSIFSWTPTPGDRLQDKARTWCRRKRFKWQRKTNTPNFVPVQTETACVPQEEDWDREIEEFSCKISEEKEDKLSSNSPYDAEEELKIALCEMSLYSIPDAQRQHHYNPSTHHAPPVLWIRRSAHVAKDQFTDAEE